VVNRTALFVFAALLAACGGGSSDNPAQYDGPPIPWPYQKFPAQRAPSDNPSTKSKIALGRLLFYDPILSSDHKVACATCHSEVWGLSDGLARSIGVDGDGPTGPGRVGQNVTRRNAPTLWNVGQKRALFWDGRADSLEAQVLAPLSEPAELGRDPAEIAAALAAIPDYASRFAAAFPHDPKPNATNLTRALAALERSFVTSHAPYDQYVAGDAGALDTDTVDGMYLFAEAGCADCHAPPLFASERFADRGVVSADADAGRKEITGASADDNAFAVPTLRNVRESDPYFHDGSVAKLDDAVAREVARSVAEGTSRELSADETARIVRFLDKALTDTSHAPYRPDDVPSGYPVPVDGFRIPR
jgi:cytochrome c peroxidase